MAWPDYQPIILKRFSIEFSVALRTELSFPFVLDIDRMFEFQWFKRAGDLHCRIGSLGHNIVT